MAMAKEDQCAAVLAQGRLLLSVNMWRQPHMMRLRQQAKNGDGEGRSMNCRACTGQAIAFREYVAPATHDEAAAAGEEWRWRRKIL